MNLEEAQHDPHIQARQLVVDLLHESWGAYRQLGDCPEIFPHPGDAAHHAPELGEHTAAILQELGYGPDQVEELRQQGVV